MPAPSETPWRGAGSPMLAVAGQPPTGADYWREWKFDGHRARAQTGHEPPRLISRGGRLVTDRFPEIAEALREVLGSRMAVLDGELVAPGRGGRPDFERLQARARSTATTARRVASPVNFVVFDLIGLDGLDLTGRALRQRRALLGELGLEHHNPRLLLSPVFTDVDPEALLAAAREHGMEGVLSKRSSSRYAAGRRSKAWVKTVLRRIL